MKVREKSIAPEPKPTFRDLEYAEEFRFGTLTNSTRICVKVKLPTDTPSGARRSEHYLVLETARVFRVAHLDDPVRRTSGEYVEGA
jgi:hypothetical protein